MAGEIAWQRAFTRQIGRRSCQAGMARVLSAQASAATAWSAGDSCSIGSSSSRSPQGVEGGGEDECDEADMLDFAFCPRIVSMV